MKKVYFLLIASFVFSPIHSQSLIDGLRYSTDNLNGTARYSSMSGAFGALGGDLTAMVANPAGSAVFMTSSASVSLSMLDKKNETNYFNNSLRNYNSNVNFNQAGIVFVFDHVNDESPWNKFTIGLNYDMTNNFNDEFISKGQSNTSIDQYFLNFAQGIPLNLLQRQPGQSISQRYSILGETRGYGAQQAFLGYQSYILEADSDNPNNMGYFSNIAPGVFNQEFSQATAGYNAKYTLNVATQYNDNLYLGINLNSHLIDYRESTYYYESNNNEGSLVNQVGFRNNLSVIGNGFSAQFGAILKATDQVRLGLAFDTPTWYVISEQTSQHITTRRTENGENITEIIHPDITNIYPDYRLRTPGKLTGSMAYLFGREGLISIDYSYRDYSTIEFRPTNEPVFNNINNHILSTLRATSSVRVGGEYRWNQMSFRGGFRYEQSPYEDPDVMSDLTGVSFGLGYNFGTFRIDAAYARAAQERNQQLFQGPAFTNSSTINTVNNFVTLTVGFIL